MSLSGIWTAKGIDKLAAQTAGGPTLNINKIALGDGGGIVPAVLPSQVALFKEVWRGLVNAVLVEPDTPNAVTVEAVIPYSVGGFHIREWGIYDTDGDLIAVGPHAEFYKPLLAEGSGAELLERIQLPLTNAGQVNLSISSEALATRKFVVQAATDVARAEVARHDEEEAAHGGMTEELHKHIQDMDNPHQTPLPPLATLEKPGLVYPDGSSCTVSGAGLLSSLTGAQWRGTVNYRQPVALLGLDGKMYLWRKPSGPGMADVGAKEPGKAGSEDFWLDYADSLFAHMWDFRIGQYEWWEDDLERPGWEGCLGGVVENFSHTYPRAAAYFDTPHGKKRLVTQAEYDALHVATWHTNADGSKVGWKGIGGVNKFVWDKVNDTLRLPDLAGMTPEQIGDGLLGVGGVHGDGSRRVVASADNPGYGTFTAFSGAFFEGAHYLHDFAPGNGAGGGVNFDSARVTPVAAKVQPRAWGSLACVYLGQPAS